MRVARLELQWTILAILLAGSLTFPTGAAPRVQTIEILMGTPEREMVFVPGTITLTSGARARLIVMNRGKVTHDIHLPYLKDLESRVKAGGIMIEGKGIDGVHADPGKTFTWEFVPQRKGRTEIRCELPRHYEQGMKGTLVIQ